MESDDGPVRLDEIPAGGRADLLRPDFLDLREERLREVPRAEAFARAEQHALERDAVLLVPRPGADLLVGPSEFRLRRGRPFQLLDFPVEHGLDTVQRGAGRQRRVRDEQGGVQLRLEADADVRRELRLDEGPIQSVRSGPPVSRRERDESPPPSEDGRQEDERGRVLVGRAGDVPADREEVRGTRTFEVAPPLAALLRLREAKGVRRRLRLQAAERLADVLHRDGHVEPADEDQGRVVWSVEPEVVAVQRVAGEGREVLLIPDRRPMVRVDVEREPPQLLLDREVGLVLRAFPLADHDRAFRLDLFRVERRVAHALRLDHQGRVQRGRGDCLEVHRVVGVREGVHLAAEAGDQLVDVPLRELAAALEQHVLDPMGGAGHAGDLVPRADSVDDPRGQGLRVRDRPEDDLQAVAQGLDMGGHLRRGNAGARYQVARRERRRKFAERLAHLWGTRRNCGTQLEMAGGPFAFSAFIRWRRFSRNAITLRGWRANSLAVRPWRVAFLWSTNASMTIA